MYHCYNIVVYILRIISVNKIIPIKTLMRGGEEPGDLLAISPYNRFYRPVA
jgi:hypothetical protein